SGLHLSDEAAPPIALNGQDGPVKVLRVAHGHRAGRAGPYLDAVAAAVAAVAGLAPAQVDCFHRSSATSRMSSREASRGRASPRTRSKAAAAFRTSDRFSMVWSTIASMRRVSGIPSAAAMSNAPPSPALAPWLAG